MQKLHEKIKNQHETLLIYDVIIKECLISLDRYDQKVPADLVKIKTTLEEATTTMQQTTSTEKPIAGRRCFENKKHMPKHELYSTHVETQCETTAACASMYDERTSEHAMFCDEKKLCIKHNISSGECTEVGNM